MIEALKTLATVLLAALWFALERPFFAFWICFSFVFVLLFGSGVVLAIYNLAFGAL